MLITDDRSGGYWVVGEDGGLFAHHGAPYFESLPGLGVVPSAPIIGGAAPPFERGVWLVGADTMVYALGNAPYHGPHPGWTARWGIGTPSNPCIGIAARGAASYVLGAAAMTATGPAIYAMEPDGRYAVAP